ncbi:MAG TPA: methyltransferase domain-containing protein [Allosphingosinicella sp.]|nr:methyltransferase domain-containing protein [Allosphingosinicella sp.]
MSDRDYVLGTQDEEIERLGLQHRVWRPRVLDAWRRAGISVGQTIIDVGAGPGYATTDLAEIVGPGGRVLALERSSRFLAALGARTAAFGLANVEAREHDVSAQDFGDALADAAWCRWVLSFVEQPQRTVRHIARALKPGGVAIFHEYADYGAWQMMPPSADVDRFRTLVMQSWRDAGGEPDIGLTLPRWLEEDGLEIIEMRPLIDMVQRSSFVWQWPLAFMRSNAARLVELGYATPAEAERFATALDGASPSDWMITPLVLEVIARRR